MELACWQVWARISGEGIQQLGGKTIPCESTKLHKDYQTCLYTCLFKCSKRWFITHRIHGAAIYGNMDPINIPQMLAYIPAPWILWVLVYYLHKKMFKTQITFKHVIFAST